MFNRFVYMSRMWLIIDLIHINLWTIEKLLILSLRLFSCNCITQYSCTETIKGYGYPPWPMIEWICALNTNLAGLGLYHLALLAVVFPSPSCCVLSISFSMSPLQLFTVSSLGVLLQIIALFTLLHCLIMWLCYYTVKGHVAIVLSVGIVSSSAPG